MNTESLLSKTDVMERLGVSDKTLRRLVGKGLLRVIKLGKTSPLKFRQLDVARCLEALAVTGPASASYAQIEARRILNHPQL